MRDIHAFVLVIQSYSL